MTDAPVSDQAAAAPGSPVPATTAPNAASSPSAASAKPAPPRSMDEIEAELDATRARLAGRIDELEEYVQPKNVARRQLDKLRGVFVDEYGGIKPDRVLLAAGIVVAVLGVGAVLRRRRG